MNFRFLTFAAGWALLLSACNQAPQGPNAPEPSLVGPTWILRSVHFGSGSVAVTPSHYTLNFTDSGIVHAQVSCHDISAPYEATASSVKLTGTFIMNRMQCEESAFSDEMLEVLDSTAVHYAIQDSTLCLSLENRKACFRTR
jgi:heat shock protein HslJ